MTISEITHIAHLGQIPESLAEGDIGLLDHFDDAGGALLGGEEEATRVDQTADRAVTLYSILRCQSKFEFFCIGSLEILNRFLIYSYESILVIYYKGNCWNVDYPNGFWIVL